MNRRMLLGVGLALLVVPLWAIADKKGAEPKAPPTFEVKDSRSGSVGRTSTTHGRLPAAQEVSGPPIYPGRPLQECDS